MGWRGRRARASTRARVAAPLQLGDAVMQRVRLDHDPHLSGRGSRSPPASRDVAWRGDGGARTGVWLSMRMGSAGSTSMVCSMHCVTAVPSTSVSIRHLRPGAQLGGGSRRRGGLRGAGRTTSLRGRRAAASPACRARLGSTQPTSPAKQGQGPGKRGVAPEPPPPRMRRHSTSVERLRPNWSGSCSSLVE